MAKTVVVVIQEDPRKTHRPVEALRIALGLVAGSHHTTVVILEKYLPSIEQLEIPFILQSQTDRAAIREEFHTVYNSDEAIRQLIASAERSLVF